MTALMGTAPLARLVLRRDRVRLSIWLALLVSLPALTPSSLAQLFPIEAARASYAAGVAANPAIRSLQGPIYGSDLGALTAARTLTITAVLVALLSVLTVVRHTRAEEEAGRCELLGSTRLGRQAGLVAALVVVGGLDLVLAVAVVAVLVGAGLPAAGSVGVGLALGTVGWVFAGVAALVAQLSESTRAASGIGIAALGAAYLLRAAGDAGGSASWLSWLSPLGWVARVRPFAGERWEVLALSAAAGSVLVGAAAALSARRDVGAGVLPPRLGAGSAVPRLSGPFGLAWRLHRGSLLAWTAGFAVVGVAFGSVAQGVRQIVASSPQLLALLARLGGSGDLVEEFLAAELGVLGLLAAGYAVSAALRLRTEETEGRAEPVLATPVGRLRWTGSHLLFALLGPALALLAAGLGAGLAHGMSSGDVTTALPRVLGGALVALPAVWVVAGIALALVGLLPQLTALAWGSLAGFVVLGQLGPLLRLDQRVLDLSPFTHLPRLPGGEVSATPLLWLCVTAAALVVAGITGFRRRDVG